MRAFLSLIPLIMAFGAVAEISPLSVVEAAPSMALDATPPSPNPDDRIGLPGIVGTAALPAPDSGGLPAATVRTGSRESIGELDPAATPPAFPPNPVNSPLLAVIPLQSIGTDSAASRIATAALTAELLRTGEVRLLERDQMNQVLLEQGFQQAGPCDESVCAVQIGRLLGADQVLIGSLGRIGRSVFLNVRLVRVESGELVTGVQRSERGELDDVLPRLIESISQELVVVVTGNPVPPRAEREVVAKAPGISVEARRNHGVILGVEMADFDGDGKVQNVHWKLSPEIKRLCCIDVAWHRWQMRQGLFSLGPSLNAGTWVRSGFDPDVVGFEFLMAGSGQINFTRILGSGGFLRADVGLTQLTISRRETGADWGVGVASSAGWWIPLGGRSFLISVGTGWREYFHLEYDQLWLGNFSLGILL